MLTQTRETVLNALLALLGGAVFSQSVRGKSGFVIVSRRLQHWSEVPKSERPALFMVCHQEQPTYRNENMPAYMKLSVKLFIYTDGSDKFTVPDTDVSVILDALDTVLSPGNGPKQTLGGLVSHVRVSGDVLRDPGDIDGDGIIIVPVDISLT